MGRKKMFITIALIIVMLLNCIAPMLQAQAATAKTTMSFNSALYKGLKSYFQEKEIKASYNDDLHTIQMDENTIASIEELSLKEKGISDITGLDVFTNVKKLILSANSLDENSNLSVLNNFSKLVYLDISSNQISDISSIQALVERLIALDSNAINLSGQNVKLVVDVSLDSNEQQTEVEYALPQILQIAGIANNGTIKNKGILKSDWVNGKYYETSTVGYYAPYIVNSSIPNPISSTNNTFKIKVGADYAGSFLQYEGLIKWVINIKDTSTVSYNVNPASKNLLKDSIFTLYYVVHSDEYEGVIFKDNNLYNAVKEQLTKHQIVNSDLLSYKYFANEDSSISYDVCDVTLDGTTATLKIDGTTVYTISNFSASGYNTNALIKKASGEIYEIQNYEVEYVDTYNNSGVLTRTLKVKIQRYNDDARNLYVDCYDEPYALVITNSDIINKITSLILNDQRIQDLTGLEKFVGLKSNLNVSYNYVDTLANIYALELNKESANSSIQEKFNAVKSVMETNKSVVTDAYKNATQIIESIKEKIKEIEKAIEEAEALDDTAENYEEELKKYQDKVKAAIEAIKGDGTDENKGLLGDLDKTLNDSTTGLNPNLSKLYSRFYDMYNVFNKEYKLTTLLIPEMNYQDEEEYKAFSEKMKTLNGVKELVSSEVSRISTLEEADALSELEKDLIRNAFGLDASKEIKETLGNLVTNYTEANASRAAWTGIINKMLEIDIYSQAANYCLLERMNHVTPIGKCYAEEYLAEKIKDFEYEGIDTELLTAIYERLLGSSVSTIYDEDLYNIFANYEAGTRDCVYGTAYFCEGNYYDVYRIGYDNSVVSSILGNYPDELYLIEELYVLGTNFDDTYFFNQFINLANKFTAIDETSRYVTLPVLKRIDIRNNEIENLGETSVKIIAHDGSESISNVSLADLKNLRELYAGHNIVTGDIASVDWEKMTGLKKLDLSYNYITDISPLQVLSNLRYLDLSDNLLEGAFNLNLKEMPKLKNLVLAGNKYEDITQILIDYEMEANGDFTNYFAREDTINIDLSRQELEIDIEEPIAYDRNKSVFAIDLPPIFAQLEFIDATRTAYGTTSSKGTITAKGGVAYVPVSKSGEFAGIVKVIAANGYPEDVTTSIGINSSCTIRYVVKNISVNSVKINEDVTRMLKGTSKTFTATVEGENVDNKTVEWSVSGNASENTKITSEGLLTVAADETANEITITAKSNYDDSVEASKTISLYTREVTGVTVKEQGLTVKQGKSVTYTAEVTGNNLEDSDKTVTWSVTGNTSENTKITSEGLLTVAADETATSLTVKATSTVNTEKSGTSTVTVPELVEVPTLGYTVDSDDDIVGISPDTTSQSFKSKLLSDSNYTVVVKRNGTEIADTAKVATGDIVVILKGNKVISSYEIVVKGDVNGDGTVDISDTVLVKAHRAKLSTLTGVFFKAADVDDDSEITISDVRLILAHRAKINGYTL